MGAGTHVGHVEERVRRVKETYKSLQASRPFKFGDALACWAMRYAVYTLNLTPMRHNPSATPKEILTGVKPDFKVVLPVGFAELCQVQQKRVTNSITEFKTISALNLLPNGNGSVFFASLTTGRVISRDQFKIVQPIPNEFLLIIKVLQERGVFAIEGSGEEIELDLKDPNSSPSLIPDKISKCTYGGRQRPRKSQGFHFS